MTREERGATLVVVTLATLVLFGFAALAVDVGYGMSERRRAQSTVDASVLAAAVELNAAGATFQDLVDQALLFADENAPGPIPISDWINNCPDTVEPQNQLEHTAAELAELGQLEGPATDCISFNATFTEIRVSLPQQVIDTYFGGVIGIDSFDVTAFAHATVHLPGLASSPPFVVTSGTSGGDEVCLRAQAVAVRLPARWVGNDGDPASVGEYLDDGTPVPPDPCDETQFDRDSQFYGTLRAYRYADCRQPTGNPGLSSVIADGIDHLLGTFGPDGYTVGDPEAFDGGPPPRFTCGTALPNTLQLGPGFQAQALKLGFLSTTATIPRFKLNPENIDGTRFAGETLDNTPLWEYLNGTSSDPECERAESGSGDSYDHFDRKEDLLWCLKDWDSGVIFEAGITTSSRFAWIPYVAESTLREASAGPRGTYAHTNAFAPVFFSTLYQNGQQRGQSDECWTKHPDAGQGWSRHDAGQPFDCGRSNANVDAVAAIVIPCGALPDTVCIDDGQTGSPAGFPVLQIELTR